MTTRRQRRTVRARRARWLVATVAVTVLVGLGVAALAAKGADRAQSLGASGAASPSSSSAAPTTASTAAPTTTTVDPGTLPQTAEKPVASGAAFDARVEGLWSAIVAGDPAPAMPFFFPLSAYLQVKAISNPAQDYAQRLVANYANDVRTLHAQLGANAARAQLAGVDVPDSQAVWVAPGSEYNKLSYWRVYGTVLRYTVDGAPRSFTVSSLISWRGDWYVVHLGLIR